MALLFRPIGQTLFGVGSYTALGAPGDVNAAVATLTFPIAGTYVVTLLVGFGNGSPAGPEVNNMKLRKTPLGGSIADIAGAILTTPAAVTVIPHTFVLQLSGGDIVTVAVIAQGTAAVVYMAGLYAYQV